MSKPKKKKWATRYEASAPVTVVAKDCIEERLKSVWRFAPLAAQETEKDVEQVHQLRVCVRRANAAIKLYAPLLKRKEARRIRKQLRAFRRAAGPARDLDVLAARLAQIESGSSEEGLENLCSVVATHRAKAQSPIKKVYRRAKRKKFVKDIKRFVKSVKWRSDEKEPDFRSFAVTAFQPIIDRFFAAGEADLRDIDALHQLRIEGKTVRYAMELLSPAFDESFRKELYPVFALVQDKLGATNDHASAISFYRRMLESADVRDCAAVIERMIELENNNLEESRSAFVDWWSPQRVSEMRQKFDATLMRSLDPNEKEDVINVRCDSKHARASIGDGKTSGGTEGHVKALS